MRLKQLAKLFDKRSVSVCGMKGTGKDMLFANIIAKRKYKYYISNMDYKITNKIFRKEWINFDPKLLRVGNDYQTFLNGKVKEYVYPYPDNTDIYISDCGIYFPSQYSGRLDVEYKDIPTFLALSRQLGNCYVHTNCQALGRVWNKIREQSDVYIVCQRCFVVLGFVIQKIRIYENYESAEKNVIPFRLSMPMLNSQNRQNVLIERQRYYQNYGKIQEKWLFYRNKSKYDTRRFKTILERGENYE